MDTQVSPFVVDWTLAPEGSTEWCCGPTGAFWNVTSGPMVVAGEVVQVQAPLFDCDGIEITVKRPDARRTTQRRDVIL